MANKDLSFVGDKYGNREMKKIRLSEGEPNPLSLTYKLKNYLSLLVTGGLSGGKVFPRKIVIPSLPFSGGGKGVKEYRHKEGKYG